MKFNGKFLLFFGNGQVSKAPYGDIELIVDTYRQRGMNDFINFEVP